MTSFQPKYPINAVETGPILRVPPCLFFHLAGRYLNGDFSFFSPTRFQMAAAAPAVDSPKKKNKGGRPRKNPVAVAAADEEQPPAAPESTSKVKGPILINHFEQVSTVDDVDPL